ncbi:MAG: Omp28-related outer membrane protein [Prevotella sp.]|nr:Omp28-related outer membrane protein [Prevotella sp.]
MRKILISLVTLLCSTALHAQQIEVDVPLSSFSRVHAPSQQVSAPSRVEGLSSTQRAVGYAVGDSITISGARVGSAGTYPVGAIVDASVLERFAGCKVMGIRYAVSQDLGRTRAFLYPVTDDGYIDDGAAIAKNQKAYAGWNNVFFNGDTSYEIQGDEQLLVGFDYVETDEMVAAESGALCTYGESSGTELMIYANFASGEGWYQVNNLGCLCVQLIVDVSSLPEKDLDIIYFDSGFRYKKPGENVELYAIVQNVGRSDVANYELSCQLDEQPETIIEGAQLKESADETFQPVVSLPSDIAVGKHTLTFRVKSADGESLGGTKNDTETVNFYVYNETMSRQKVYVEQYTDQNYYLSADVNNAFANATDVADIMCMVNVYAPDNLLALPESNYLHGLYAYTLPSFTVNRSYFPGENYIAYDVNYYIEYYPVFVPTIISALIEEDKEREGFATVEMTPEYNADTRELTIDVGGTLTSEAEAIFGDVAVTLMITEDNVKAAQQVLNPVTNRPKTDAQYVHNHVLRQYVTAPTGDKVTINGTTFSGHFSTTLSEEWKGEDLKLVAVVTRYAPTVTDDNVMEMDVVGANDFDLSTTVPTGITSLTPDPSPEGSEYFTLDGVRLNGEPSHSGIYLFRQNGKTKKVLIK